MVALDGFGQFPKTISCSVSCPRETEAWGLLSMGSSMPTLPYPTPAITGGAGENHLPQSDLPGAMALHGLTVGTSAQCSSSCLAQAVPLRALSLASPLYSTQRDIPAATDRVTGKQRSPSGISVDGTGSPGTRDEMAATALCPPHRAQAWGGVSCPDSLHWTGEERQFLP